jgi:hypothetical protein
VTDAPRHARGRHAKPPSEFSQACDRTLRTVMAEHNRRKIVVVWSGAASLVLGVAAVVGLSMAGSVKSSTATPAGADGAARSSARATGAMPTARPMAGGSATPVDGSDVQVQAMTFLKGKDPGDKVTRHVKTVVESGDFLRVYTDLPEDDTNSGPAISLCEWTSEYLADLRGSKDPVVFVHAKESDNGSVVLANKQNAKDDCEVGETR